MSLRDTIDVYGGIARLGRDSGVSRRTIHRILAGRVRSRGSTTIRLAMTLGMEHGEFRKLLIGHLACDLTGAVA